jgi:ribosomal protein L21E
MKFQEVLNEAKLFSPGDKVKVTKSIHAWNNARENYKGRVGQVISRRQNLGQYAVKSMIDQYEKSQLNDKDGQKLLLVDFGNNVIDIFDPNVLEKA